MPLQGARSDSMDLPFSRNDSNLQLLNMVKELDSKVNSIAADCEQLKEEMKSLKLASGCQETNSSQRNKPAWCESNEEIETIKMMVMWYVEDGNWENLREGLLKVLSKKCKTYWQAYRINTNSSESLTSRIGRSGYTELALLLLDGGMSVNSTDVHISVPRMLHAAAENDRRHLVQVLLEKGADTEARGYEGHTALIHASRNNRIEVVKMLVEAGADVNNYREDGNTSLHLSASSGYVDVVKYLVDSGANTTAVNKEYNTPLDLAIMYQRTQVEQLLSQQLF